jgi:hypothetical protein
MPPRPRGTTLSAKGSVGMRRASPSPAGTAVPTTGGLAVSHTETPAARAELERLVHDYRHLHEEHRHAHRGSRVRRRLGGRLRETELQFEHVLAALPLEDEVRHAWREHLHHHAPAPPLPPAEEPLTLVQGASVPWPGPADVPLSVYVSGVPAEVRAELEQALARIAASSPRPILHARGSLERGHDRAVERPVQAKAVLDLGPHAVRAGADGTTPAEALDLLEERLRRGLHEWSERENAVRRGRAR